jgi:arylsulfatase A-like enzyme
MEKSITAFMIQVLALVAGFSPAVFMVGAEKPNIVLIIADDLGYGELGFQGCTEIPTPHIDSIAKNGTRFTDGYVTCSMCHPSRAGMMTGRHQVRFGIEGNPPIKERNYGVPTTEPMLSERLKQLGYTTGLIGKWHLGSTKELTPLRRGFDEFYGIHHGGHSFLPTSKQRTKGRLMRGDQEITEETYLTTALGREAVTFVDRHHRTPFFLCLSFTAVHKPLEATEADLKRFPEMKPGKRKTHAAMTVSMDDAVGKVLASLYAHNLEKNTLIIFISDNGGFRAIASRNTPLRGAKWNLFEGGNRVPFAMQWTGRIPAGKVYDKPVSALDILPTSVVAAGATIDPLWKLDGVNLIPFLNGTDNGHPHETLYWRIGERQAIRHGNWKMIHDRALKRSALFDLSKDIGESTDLAGKNPKKLAELKSLYERWAKELPPAQVDTKYGRL